MGIETGRTSKDLKEDSWAYFWSQYFVFSLQAICFASNLYFFSSLRSLLNRLPLSYSYELTVASYTVVGAFLAKYFFVNIYKPGFESANPFEGPEDEISDRTILSSREFEYRKHAELRIGSLCCFSVLTAILAAMMTYVLSPSQFRMVLHGLMFGWGSILITVFGMVFVMGESEGGKRSLVSAVFGIMCLSLPLAFIFDAISTFGLI